MARYFWDRTLMMSAGCVREYVESREYRQQQSRATGPLERPRPFRPFGSFAPLLTHVLLVALRAIAGDPAQALLV